MKQGLFFLALCFSILAAGPWMNKGLCQATLASDNSSRRSTSQSPDAYYLKYRTDQLNNVSNTFQQAQGRYQELLEEKDTLSAAWLSHYLVVAAVEDPDFLVQIQNDRLLYTQRFKGDTAWMQMNISLELALNTNYKARLDTIEKYRAYFNYSKHAVAQSSLYYMIGQSYFVNGLLPRAKEYLWDGYQCVVDDTSRIDRDLIVRNLQYYAFSLYHGQSIDSARTYAEEGLRVGKTLFDPSARELLNLYLVLAGCYQSEGNYYKAAESTEGLLSITNKALGPMHFRTAVSAYNHTNVLQNIGAHHEAYATLLKYFPYLNKDPRFTLNGLESLATMSDRLGYSEAAEQYLLRAIHLSDSLYGPEFLGTLKSQRNYARFLIERDTDKSISILKNTLTVFKKIDPELQNFEQAIAISELILAYNINQEYERALSLYTASSQRNGDIKYRTEWMKDMHRSFSHLSEDQVSNLLMPFLSASGLEIPTSQDDMWSSSTLHTKGLTPTFIAALPEELMASDIKLKQYNAYRNYLKRITQNDGDALFRARVYFCDGDQLFLQLTDDLFIDAFHYAEYSKAQLLAQHVDRRLVSADDQALQERLQAQRNIQQVINAGPQESSSAYTQAITSWDSLEQLIVNDYPISDDVRLNQNKIKQLADELDATFWMIYAGCEETTHLITDGLEQQVIQHAPLVFDTLNEMTIAGVLESFEENIKDNELLNVLTYNKRLIIIPDRQYARLPFEALKIGGDYLNEVVDISYAYSFQLLDYLSSKESSQNTALCAFAPTYETQVVTEPLLAALMRSDYYALPGAQDEARSIADLWDGDLFMAKDASKSSFEESAGEYGLYHLAMHAQSDGYSEPYLIFPDPDTGEPVPYYASDWYNLNLEAELVTLSACNTAIGKDRLGEGMASLGSAVTVAGAKSVITSLWPAPDQSAQQIMTTFYSYLKDGDAKSTALRKAKQDYLKNTPNESLKNPYYWAGFILSGDPGVIKQGRDWSEIWWLGIAPALLIVYLYRRRS